MDFLNYIGLFPTLLLLISTIFLYYMYKRRNKDFPPGPCGLPVIGYKPFLGKNPIFTFRKFKKKYGSITSINLGMNIVVMLNDWKAVKEALVKQGACTSGRPYLYVQDEIFTDKSITFSFGKGWKERRHFTLQILRDFGFGRSSLEDSVMYEVDRLTDYLRKHAGEPIEIDELFLLPIANIIWNITTGKRFDKINKFLSDFKELFRLIMTVGTYETLQQFPFLTRIPSKLRDDWKALNAKTKMVKEHIKKEIDLHEANYDENNLCDFIDVYLAEMHKHQKTNSNVTYISPYSREHLVHIVFDLFFAAEEIPDTTLRWALLHMAMNPHVQRKVQEELDSAVDVESFLSMSSKGRVPYTEATLLEIQRHPTVAPLALPHCANKDMEIFDYKIPKGTTITANVYAVHHDEDYWGDPDVFRPERFLTEDGTKVLKHECFMPFSVGPRTCLGESLAKLELHLIFTSILRRFTLETVPGEPKPSMEFRPGSTFRMHPFRLIINPR